ncbi:rod shape-determining protein MreC [Halioxenophilus aromaticivorans]|uniref:Cell shape-determining protein MreC n=1 Tax=Halioxenophilus aromaticivorans TaxID=1306992 RepID=A0AAV3U7B7_9ALTE
MVLVDLFTPWLKPVKAKLTTVSIPFYWVTNLPARLGEWGQDNLVSRDDLLRENASLKQQVMILERKLQGLASVTTDNVRLRELMNSADMVAEQVLVAQLIGVSPDPLVHKVIVDKGSRDDVYVGQPLLDAFGLMGQVVEVGPYVSQVLLITDSTHALPVEINRNGLRAVVEGVGDLEQLALRHVSNTMDVQEGDLVISSGLGGRFPRGYPVGVVKKVERNPGKPFADVFVEPRAHLNRTRHVLLVFRDDSLATEVEALEQ